MASSAPRRSAADRVIFSPASFQAVIFDLDGVVTDTASLHAAAWKRTFDEFLERRATQRGEAFRPFDIEGDYPQYVDGRPRDEGIRSFLQSRGIQLPDGTAIDSPDQDTVWSIGSRKTERFLAVVDTQKVKVYESTVAWVRELQAAGIETALVTSSKNCGSILRAAGLSDLFGVVIDGQERERLQLEGKPAPDTFLEAARRLGVPPPRAAVVEDAVAGVEAGRRGGFGLVIGVDRVGQADALRRAGAHATVEDLSQVLMSAHAMVRTDELPSALGHFDEVVASVGGRRLAVFLDYDGTLTPIVLRPEDARLAESTRRVLTQLAQRMPVAIVSGRDVRDVQRLVGLDAVHYAGSHGFEIVGPAGQRVNRGLADDFLPVLDEAEKELHGDLRPIPGATIERKRFTIAIHYRQVMADAHAAVAAVVDRVAAHQPRLRKARGKMVVELQPDIDWHKGKAVRHLLTLLDSPSGGPMPLYIGDDLTDEDAFEAIADDGVSIVVRDEARPTRARFALDGPDEVEQFLERLCAASTAESTT